MKSETFHFSFFVFHLLPIAALAYAFGNFQVGSLPQIATGGDVLSVIFGDAREVLSRAAVQKADSYFHGGVDMECPGLHEHRHEGAHAEPDHESEARDPWRWLNFHIRAPEVDRHLEGAQAVELMPWFWASVTADPHNAGAWSDAWHIARYAMKDRELAARVLAEAVAANPESIEIAFTVGRAHYDGGKGDLAAAGKWFRKVLELANAKRSGGAAGLTDREEEAVRFAGNYLKGLGEESR